MGRRPHRAASVTVVACLAVGLISALASPAAAIGLGPRGGLSFDPDQLVLGVQAELFPLVPLLDFVPSIDLGFGNDVSVMAINADLQYNFPALPSTNVNIFLLGGPTIAHVDPDGADGTTEIGLSAGGGLRVPLTGPASYYAEVRFGFGDVPDLKAVVGILFGL